MIIDGVAVFWVLTASPIFNAPHLGKHNGELQLCAFDDLAVTAMISIACRYGGGRRT